MTLHFPPLSFHPPPFPAEPPLSAALGELAHWWLDIRCPPSPAHAAGYSVHFPLRLMAAQRGWESRLGDVLPRLRRTTCGQAPASVELVAGSGALAPNGTSGYGGSSLPLAFG